MISADTFDLTRSFLETRAERALISVIALRPRMTLRELVTLVRSNPELGDMSIDHLFERLRERAGSRASELRSSSAELPRARRHAHAGTDEPMTRSRSDGPSTVEVTHEAGSRIRGHEPVVDDLVRRGLEHARELGVPIEAVEVRARWSGRDEAPASGIIIDFHASHPRANGEASTDTLWARLHDPASNLPFPVALIVS